MSKSNSSQQTQSTSNVQNVDRRVGVEGEGNLIVGEGGSASIVNNDVSDKIATAALDANKEVSSEALAQTGYTASRAMDANRGVSESAIRSTEYTAARALDANKEVSAEALKQTGYATGRALDTAEAVTSRAIESAVRLGEANLDLTETTRRGNAELAKSFVDKATTAISDSRRDTNEKILTDAIKYGAGAVIALGLLFAVLTRKKA